MLSDENHKELLKFKNNEFRINGRLRGRARYLKDLGYIERYRPPDDCADSDGFYIDPPAYRITPLGEDVSAEFEKAHQQESEAKRQQRFENKISVASVLVPAITFILGLLVEHFSGIIELLLRIFE